MKKILLSLARLFAPLALAAAVSAADKPATPDAKISTALDRDGGQVVVNVHGIPAPAPTFFSAEIDHLIRISLAEIGGEMRMKLRVVQGRPEKLTLGLVGDGEVVDVSGGNLRDWSVRQTGAARFLDLRLATIESPASVDLVVRTRLRQPAVTGAIALLLAAPGDAVGFTQKITLQSEPAAEFRVVSATGLTPVHPAASAEEPAEFFTTRESKLEVKLQSRGAARPDLELTNATLAGKVNEATRSVTFHLRGQLRAQKTGARLRFLSGRAAMAEQTTGDGWHIELMPGPDVRAHFSYDLVAERAGMLPLDVEFAAALTRDGDWRAIDFTMPAGAVVPLQLEGVPASAGFKPGAAVVPVAAPNAPAQWQGFLPASGAVSLAWRHQREAAEGALFFNSTEQTEVRPGAGLLRQTVQLSFRVLQGKLASVRCQLAGAGEILGVDGSNVVGWKVIPAGDGNARVLEVQFSRPIETEGTLTIRSQAEPVRQARGSERVEGPGAWLARAEPLRITPEGGVRHSGFVRIANSGAVQLEVAETSGLMQLAPAQFPGAAIEKEARQVFVYRFPSANYRYAVVAKQIQPEISVSQVVTYELGETARVINAALELDVREAPLREWSLQIPADYTVAGVSGAEVADYVAETESASGRRTLRILFGRAIEGRQLLQLRLEKNQSAAAGDWMLPPLVFPEAKSVRGHVGAIATAGFRLLPAQADGLVELPLSFFPKQTTGLQQAWRLREPSWSAALRIEALGQSVQADVFHLYSLKEGVVYGSVLVNYFVVGAPASEWRLEVPAALGNIDVLGQNVRRDWRREGDQVIVSLHQPVLGAATLLVTFEQPMSARGGVIAPGQVRPLGVQAERGFVQVVSPLQVKHEIRHIEGALLKLEPMELPAEFRLLTSSPSLAVYQYTARPFAFEMNIEWYAPGETLEQVIDFARLSSQIARDGQVVTEAQFFVKTRGRKPLRLVLPAGVQLWEARVDHEVVNARADGEQTLVPLPAHTNPNEPVTVTLRLGQIAKGSGTTIKLLAPRAATAPTVIDEWIVRADPERVLVPQGGNAELARPVLTETGFEWISSRGTVGTFVTLALLGAGVLLLRARDGWRVPAGMAICALALLATGVMTSAALHDRRPNVQTLTYAATIVPAGDAVSLQLANVPAWRAFLVWWGVAAAVAGGVLAAWPALVAGPGRADKRRLSIAVVGTVLFATGLLAQRGGAFVFFAVTGLAILWRVLLPAVIQWRERRESGTPPLTDPGAAGAAGTVSLLVLTAILALGGGAPEAGAAVAPKSAPKPASIARPAMSTTPPPTGASAALLDGTKPFQSLVQRWTLRGDRLFAEVELMLRGAPGESFLLLSPPAVLTEFRGDGLRVSKVAREGETRYYVTPEREGLLSAHARFEMPLAERAQRISLPTGPAAAQRLTVELEQSGWEIVSPMAVAVIPTPNLPANRSGATLVLAPHAAPEIRLQPKQRDTSAEATQFFAEAAHLFLPAPGAVNGTSRVTIRPVQGRVSEIEVAVPAGLTVGDVTHGPVGSWRFDPEKRRLRVTIEPSQTSAFSFEVETQLGTGELPFALALEPLRVIGATSDVGTLAIAFGGDAQPENIRPTDLSPINVQDFDAKLLPRTRAGQPLATVQNVWRYGASGGRVELKVAPVAPEVRATARQVLSLDDDRMVMSVELRVAITRVGLFKLSFALPEGLEVEALTGAALSHWTETPDAASTAGQPAQRIITLQLNGRTIGEHDFHLTLAGGAPRAQNAWAFPRLSLREATRQTGEVLVVPGKGLRLRAVEREKVTQLDPRSVGGQQPGTLAFRLLQEDWVLRLGIEVLEPWVTVQALQEVTLREGQSLTRIAARFRVENAAIKTARLRLPALAEETTRTVRATGPAVSDIVRVTDTPDTWEIRFQRGIAGDTDVQIEFQSPAPAPGNERNAQETIATPEFIGARQTQLLVAIRSGGRLELDAANLPRGWTRADWNAVPVHLQQRGDRSVPALCFRVAEPEGALAVAVKRHGVAAALKLRVTEGNLLTLFAPNAASLTSVELKIDVLEKSTLRVRLPQGARLFNTFVNGESTAVVRDGDAFLFYVSPNTGSAAGRPTAAAVRLVYSATPPQPGRRIALVAPSLSVPLENVAWRVVLPPGYDLENYSGGLRLREERAGAAFGLDEYQSAISSKRSADAKEAMSLLSQANSWLQKGETDKASQAFSQVSNGMVLDAASNEDARVQLRNLKTQQTVLGLATRRQRLYLDNKADANRNDQLELAANANPLLNRGTANFKPQEFDQLLTGNTAEETGALRAIATRIVDQQLGLDPAPSAIDVTLPERGRVVTFTRSLQVDGAAPLELRLAIEKITRPSPIVIAGVLAVLAAIVTADRMNRLRANSSRL